MSPPDDAPAVLPRAGEMARPEAAPTDPLWYKDAIIYQLHVKAFFDANNDGIGDFEGLTRKLDYLQDLGVTVLWLLPFYPSPLRDDGYDIADYRNVHPAYGRMGDFKVFVREAHRRGLRIITELVINHTSSQHPWFQRARLASPDRRCAISMCGATPTRSFSKPRIIFHRCREIRTGAGTRLRAYYWHVSIRISPI
jgi:maltose alpha-D-glucosyltransferase/alpha-amylase